MPAKGAVVCQVRERAELGWIVPEFPSAAFPRWFLDCLSLLGMGNFNYAEKLVVSEVKELCCFLKTSLLWTSEALGFLPPFQRNRMANLEAKPSQECGLECSDPPAHDPLPVPGGQVVV